MASEHESILSSYRVDGKVAVVTGGSRGIGFGCARALDEAGADVVLVARAGPGLEEAAASIPGAAFRACDVTDPAQVREVIGGLPRIDILVNSAGGNVPESFLDVSEEHLHALIDLNLMGTFRVTQAAARVMAAGGGGCVVNISSDFGHVGFPGRSVYCLTKHGVEGLTKAVALELAPLGIRVNSVCPTFIETPLTRPYFADPEFYRQAVSRIPLGRIGQVNEVAAAVLFLASPASSLVTGASLLVDGGWTAQ
jgi:NAD(P)-dependent dehydrogenase (short-subunit alcohol dehydrogenase family)